MNSTSIRVVYDCVVFLQGAGCRDNAARKCLDLVDDGTVQLCLSREVLAEIEEVLQRAEIVRKFPLLQSQHSQTLLRTARSKAMLLTTVPKAFKLPRDPDDEPYTDLAIAAKAKFLVTWNDRRLTYLMRQDTPEGKEFRRLFPDVKIVDPPTFLSEMRRLNAP